MCFMTVLLFGWFIAIWHSVSRETPRNHSITPSPPFSLSLSLEDIPKHHFVTSAQANVQPLYPCGDREWLYVEHDDRKMEDFLRSTFPDLAIGEAFRFIVEEADLYRYAVINEYGGMYMDSDTECRHPVKEWMEIMGLDHIESDSDSPSGYILQNVLHRTTVPLHRLFGAEPIGHRTVRVTMVIGIEFYDIEHPLNNFDIDTHSQFVQWAFLSKSRNPILSAVIDQVLLNVVTIPDEKENILARTGPVAFTKAILSFIAEHSVYDTDLPLFDYRQIDAAGQLIPLQFQGDILWILVLPYRAFGFYGYHPDAVKETPRTQRLITHKFEGSWKLN